MMRVMLDLASSMTNRQQCQCLTKQGKGPRCTRLSQSGSIYCYQHQHHVKPTIALKVVRSSDAPETTTLKDVTVLVDLRRFATHVPVSGVPVQGKVQIIRLLQQLIQQTETQMKRVVGSERQKHQFRLSQFKKAVATLIEVPGDITSGVQARGLPGIGKGIADRIDEIIRTGTLSELAQKESTQDPQTVLIQELISVTGIGEANAQKFIEQGVISLQDLRDKASQGTIKLTH